MANVQHPSVKDGTFYYVGPAMQQWNPQGSHLINVVKQIEHEFNAQPPVPKKAAGGAPAQSQMPGAQPGAPNMAPDGSQQAQGQQKAQSREYVPPPVTFEQNCLDDLKKKIDKEMPQDMIDGLVEDEDAIDEKLQNLILCEPEVEKIQKEVNERAKSLKEMAQANKDMKNELALRLEVYASGLAQLEQIEEENKTLQKEQAEKCLTKKQLATLLTEKTKTTDKACKELEKQFLGKIQTDEPMNSKTFITQYLKQRTNYHKYQIFKVKL